MKIDAVIVVLIEAISHFHTFCPVFGERKSAGQQFFSRKYSSFFGIRLSPSVSSVIYTSPFIVDVVINIVGCVLVTVVILSPTHFILLLLLLLFILLSFTSARASRPSCSSPFFFHSTLGWLLAVGVHGPHACVRRTNWTSNCRVDSSRVDIILRANHTQHWATHSKRLNFVFSVFFFLHFSSLLFSSAIVHGRRWRASAPFTLLASSISKIDGAWMCAAMCSRRYYYSAKPKIGGGEWAHSAHSMWQM